MYKNPVQLKAEADPRFDEAIVSSIPKMKCSVVTCFVYYVIHLKKLALLSCVLSY